MFPYVLVLLSIGTGEPPDTIATFRIADHCTAVAYLLNQGFEHKDIDKKAICIRAISFGDT
jgi:hypothetical protein